MRKEFKPEIINGVEFHFVDMGDAIIVSVFGPLNKLGDFVGAFNSKDEAVRSLKAAKFKNVTDKSMDIENLKCINPKSFEEG